MLLFLTNNAKTHRILYGYPFIYCFLTRSTSRWDRYLGMTAAMTQVPVP